MNPHDPITADSPLLTAFALGELEGAQRDAVARAVEGSPALQDAVAQIRATAEDVAAHFDAAAVEKAPLEAGLLGRIERGLADAVGQGAEPPATAAAQQSTFAFDAAASGDLLADAEGTSAAGASAQASANDTAGGSDTAAAVVIPFARAKGAMRRVGAFRRDVFSLPLAALFVACFSLGGLWWAQRNSDGGVGGEFAAGSLLERSFAVNARSADGFSSDSTQHPFTRSNVPVHSRVAAYSESTANAARPAAQAGVAARSSTKQAAVAASDSVAATAAVADAAEDAGTRSLVVASRTQPQPPAAADKGGSETLAAKALGTEKTVTFRQRPFAAGGRMAREIRVVSTAAKDGETTASAPARAAAVANSFSAPPESVAPVAAAIPTVAQADAVESTAEADALPAESAGVRRLRAASVPSDPSLESASSAQNRVEDATARLMSEIATLVQPLELLPEAPVEAGHAPFAGDKLTAVTESAVPAKEGNRVPSGTSVASASGSHTPGNAGLAPVAPVSGVTVSPASAGGITISAGDATASDEAGDEAAKTPPPPVYLPVAGGQSLAGASLAELEAAAYGNMAVVLRQDGQLAQNDDPERLTEAELAARAVVPQTDLSSPYQQLRLWISARQLPPADDVDIERIVRDVASDRATFPKGTSRSERAAMLTDKQLAAIEANSPLVRAVRAYAEVMKEQPADADARLQAIAEQLGSRRASLNNRKVQELLKLITDTRNLL